MSHGPPTRPARRPARRMATASPSVASSSQGPAKRITPPPSDSDMTKFGYFSATGWWMPIDGMMPTRSTMLTHVKRNDRTVRVWKIGDVPPIGESRRRAQKDIQGWKIHVSVPPEHIGALFYTISPTLNEKRAMHKFADFDDYMANARQNFSFKACTIYPASMAALVSIARDVEAAILRTAQILASTGADTQWASLRPGPPIVGDHKIGKTGFLYCRYGGFEGPRANKGMFYDPLSEETIADPRGVPTTDGDYPTVGKRLPGLFRKI